MILATLSLSCQLNQTILGILSPRRQEQIVKTYDKFL